MNGEVRGVVSLVSPFGLPNLCEKIHVFLELNLGSALQERLTLL